MRALNYDMEEKKIQVETKGEAISIEADEQLLRQVLFNLLLNAIQAVPTAAEIQCHRPAKCRRGVSSKSATTALAFRPTAARKFSSPTSPRNEKGTGLGLAVVQQIVLAHGWEIQCLPNEPKGAVFRIAHLKLMA